MEKIKLTPRLKCVADMAGKCGVLADIGTDHAYIPMYMVQNSLADRAIASDVVDGPVKIAAGNVSENNLSDKVKVVKADGLDGVSGADTIVIAGMGGKLICEILGRNLKTAHSAKRLVLQPMTCSEDVRKLLCSEGFAIVKERLAKEENKIYNVIVAENGNLSFEDEFYFYVGKALFDGRDPLLLEFLHKKANVLKRRADGMAKSDDSSVVERSKDVYALCERFLKEAERYAEGL